MVDFFTLIIPSFYFNVLQIVFRNWKSTIMFPSRTITLWNHYVSNSRWTYFVLRRGRGCRRVKGTLQVKQWRKSTRQSERGRMCDSKFFPRIECGWVESATLHFPEIVILLKFGLPLFSCRELLIGFKNFGLVPPELLYWVTWVLFLFVGSLPSSFTPIISEWQFHSQSLGVPGPFLCDFTDSM